MAANEAAPEFLFSYGTLQLEAVQMATFGRHLAGTSDTLRGFELVVLKIDDQTVEFKFVGLSSSDIIDAEIVGKMANITIKLVSDLITATRDRGGNVIDGNSSQIRDVTDIWTFARQVRARDPNWVLVATRSPN